MPITHSLTHSLTHSVAITGNHSPAQPGPARSDFSAGKKEIFCTLPIYIFDYSILQSHVVDPVHMHMQVCTLRDFRAGLPDNNSE